MLNGESGYNSLSITRGRSGMDALTPDNFWVITNSQECWSEAECKGIHYPVYYTSYKSVCSGV